MPPKKQAIPSIVGEYDVELMTVEELRMYVKALKEEHERMRKARNLYHKDKKELLNWLKCSQENIINRKEIAIQKNLEIQKVLYDGELKGKIEDELNKILELENSENAMRDAFESFIKIKSAEILHKEKENAQMNDIRERDREIQHLEFISKLMSIELEGNNVERSQETSKALKNTFDNIVAEYRKQLCEVLEEFSENKINNLLTVLEDSPSIKCKSFLEFLEKMTGYFKDIYWQNLKIAEELNNKLISLKKELNTIKSNLRDVAKENEELSLITSPPLSPLPPTTPSSTRMSDKKKVLQELIYENYLLTLKLDMLNREYAELKEKFVAAVRRVHQIADFKALELEEKLSFFQNLSESNT